MNYVWLDLSLSNTSSFPYATDDDVRSSSSLYVKFKLEGCSATLGYVLPEIAAKFPSTTNVQIDHESFTFKPENIPSDPKDAADYRTKVLAQYLQHVRESGIFQVLEGWRNELYPVYGPDGGLLFSMERSASALFGILTYGVHMTAYTESAEGMKIWAPRRSPTKQTYPNMLDNTVAGGLSTGERPLECLIRESMEEASLPEHIARKAKAVGTMTYFHLRDKMAGGEIGLCQPECQYVYDLLLPEDVSPIPGDNEAVDFQLLSLNEVKKALADGLFKPNCAMLLMDFFVRHGLITAESEPKYLEIVARLHRRLEFPMGLP